MAAMMLVTAMPAFGVANGHASCQGAGHSNQTEPGAAGDWHERLKSNNGEYAKLFARAGEQGQDRNTEGAVEPDGQGCELTIN
jgi:hypothetical protein